jgi:hypothetical protein
MTEQPATISLPHRRYRDLARKSASLASPAAAREARNVMEEPDSAGPVPTLDQQTRRRLASSTRAEAAADLPRLRP